jgi:transposase
MSTIDDLAQAIADEDDARRRKHRAAAWLIEHDGMTSRAVAEACGVTHQTVRNWAAKA